MLGLALAAASLTLGCAEPFDVSLGESQLEAEIEGSAERICQGECVDLVAKVQGGYAPYEVNWSHGLPPGLELRRVCPNASTEYSITADDAKSEVTPNVTAVYAVDVEECGMVLGDSGSSAGCELEQCALCIPNPSFEGQAANNALPEPYVPCDNAPDTRSANDYSPTDGDTYLRFESDSDDDDREVASVPLCAGIEAGKEYRFSIDLGLDERDDGLEPATFEVWAGNSACDRAELLWAQELPADDDSWRTYDARFVPESAQTHLTLQAKSASWSRVRADNLVVCACTETATR